MSGAYARVIARVSRARGGDGHIAVFCSPHSEVWTARTTIGPPRRRGRHLQVDGRDPQDALLNLLRAIEQLL